MDMTRRNFLKSALLAAVAVSIPLDMATKLVEEKAEITDDYAYLKSGDYTEITFYGTGLSICTHKLKEDKRIELTVDGLKIDGKLNKAGILVERDYGNHQFHNLANELPLGIHTVKIAIQDDIKINAVSTCGPNFIDKRIT